MKANGPSYSSIDAKVISIINLEFVLPVDPGARSKRFAVETDLGPGVPLPAEVAGQPSFTARTSAARASTGITGSSPFLATGRSRR